MLSVLWGWFGLKALHIAAYLKEDGPEEKNHYFQGTCLHSEPTKDCIFNYLIRR